MDIDFPYAGDEARLRLLYRLPIPRAAGDLLIIGSPSASRALSRDWSGSAHAATNWSLAPANQIYDVIALPDLSSAACSGMSPSEMLRRVLQSLRPGGWVVGHVEHACTLHDLIVGRGWSALLAPARFFGRPRGCALALQRAGFVAESLWYVVPSIQSPMGLIPTDPVSGRAQFVRLARAARGTHGHWGHGVRLALARLGVGGLLQSQLFFWARRPC